MLRNGDDESVDLVLSLTEQAVAVLDMLAGPGALQPEHTRESLALQWVVRWARSSGKALWCPASHRARTETVTITVDQQLMTLLCIHSAKYGWEPVDMASAVVNDCAAHLAS